jgi:hypothetical protein
MNHFKKEGKRKQEEARKGLQPEQISGLDIQNLKNQAIGKLAREIHAERFGKEHDLMSDSRSDAGDRKKGKSRKRQGVSPLSDAGMAASNDSMTLCIKEAIVEIEELYTRIDEILFYKWDPLHLSDTNWSRDEYESYVPEVFRLALESESYDPIADHLTKIATEIMLMTENRKHDIEIAKLIFSLTKDEPYDPHRTVVEVE